MIATIILVKVYGEINGWKEEIWQAKILKITKNDYKHKT